MTNKPNPSTLKPQVPSGVQSKRVREEMASIIYDDDGKMPYKGTLDALESLLTRELTTRVEEAVVAKESQLHKTFAKKLDHAVKTATAFYHKLKDYKIVAKQQDDFMKMLLKEKRTTKEELAKYFIGKLASQTSTKEKT
jgi:hypothetical protein